MSDGLVEFLRARLDEDERVARAACGAPWEASVPNMVHVSAAAQRENRAFRTLGHVANTECVEYQHHIARHDPARVLAEVEAKRQIVISHEAVARSLGSAGPGTPPHDLLTGATNLMRNTLQYLALPYVDHPDYRNEWRP